MESAIEATLDHVPDIGSRDIATGERRARNPRPTVDTADEPGARSSTGETVARTYLMCPPSFYGVEYRINPWMHPDRAIDTGLAGAQWDRLRATLDDLGHRVHVARAAPGLPDQVFAANAAMVIGDVALAATMASEHRRPEEHHHRDWLTPLGIEQVHRHHEPFEGEGDVVLVGDRAIAGTGFRTSTGAHAALGELFGIGVDTVELVDPRWYHLDMALFALGDGTIAYYPGAFSPASRAFLADRFPDAVVATTADALAFGLNSVADGRHVVMPIGTRRLQHEVRERGFDVVEIDMTELHRAGGSAKCCVLELHAAARTDPGAATDPSAPRRSDTTSAPRSPR